MNYRPEIDGLRSLAVMSVVIYHLDPDWLPGGFVGVDIFFVISGFLITSIIYRKCIIGDFSLVDFYQRRIARLFPVMVAVLIATLIGAGFIYSKQDYAYAGAVGAAAILSLANMKLMLQGTYFNISEDAQPFLHFWSLSVEEQFYLVLPALVLSFVSVGLRKRGLLVILALGASISLIAALFLEPLHSAWVFYLLPTRAWELLLGAIIAIRESAPKPAYSLWANSVAVIGLSVILAAFFWTPTLGAFPVPGAIPAVFGTALLIWGTGHSRGVAYELLVRKSLVWCGRLSYSLYLWHWPVFCLIDYYLPESSRLHRVTWKISFVSVLTVLSYFALEQPMRRVLSAPRAKRWAFLLATASIAVLAGAGVHIRQSNYIASRVGDISEGGRLRGASQQGTTVALIGDSQASMFGLALWDLSEEKGFRINVLSVAGGDLSLEGSVLADSLEWVSKAEPDVIIFSIAWRTYLDPEDGEARINEYVRRLRAGGAHLILIGPMPIMPDSYSREYIRNSGFGPQREGLADLRARTEVESALLAIESSETSIVLAEGALNDDAGFLLLRDEEGRYIFQDTTHLTVDGARRIASRIWLSISGGGSR